MDEWISTADGIQSQDDSKQQSIHSSALLGICKVETNGNGN